MKSLISMDPSRITKSINEKKGFTLIELLVVISIIALLSSVVLSSVTKAKIRARDSARIQNARQIAIALEQYEATNNTYKVANSGLGSNGSGYVSKSGGTYSASSILSTLKSAGLYSNSNLTDPIYGTDNYYLGLCTSTNAYNVFVKLEQSQYNNSTTSISNTCGGTEAAAAGFNFIASTQGGSSGGGGGTTGFGGAYEYGMSAPGGGGDISFNGLTYKTVTAEDGKIWLDRNLGATQVATAYNDHLSYGDKYQWGRLADGHEKITNTGPTTATAVYGTTATLSSSDSPGNNLFVTISSGLYDWRNPQNNGLWDKSTGLNNPCPPSFHVPTQSEWQTWYNAIPALATCGGGNTCHTVALNSSLKLSTSGYRYRIGGSLNYLGSNGFYWSSSVAGIFAFDLDFNSGGVYPAGSNNRSYGFSVRCLKD